MLCFFIMVFIIYDGVIVMLGVGFFYFSFGDVMVFGFGGFG